MPSEPKEPPIPPMPPTPDQANRDVIDFGSLQFQNIPWDEILNKRGGVILDIKYGERHFNLQCTAETTKAADKESLKNYTLFLDDATKLEQFVRLLIVIEKKDNLVECSCNVQRTDPNELLPDKIGRLLYEKVAPFFQALANREGLPYIHTVQKLSSLSKEKWLEVFGDFFKKNDYQYQDDEHWTKTYEPQK